MSMTDFAYRHVSPGVLHEDLSFGEDAPRPGDRLPEFDLPTDDGGRVRLDDFFGHRPVLLITSSYTCPMTASSDPHLKPLHARYGGAVEFIMLHVREAHPGERRDQPATREEKAEHARKLRRRDRLPWTIAVDDPEGTVHRQLDGKPNAVYLADSSGRVVYRGLWAGDVRGLTQALDAVAHGGRPEQAESQRRLRPKSAGLGVMRQQLRSSGPRSERDMWRSAPPRRRWPGSPTPIARCRRSGGPPRPPRRSASGWPPSPSFCPVPPAAAADAK